MKQLAVLILALPAAFAQVDDPPEPEVQVAFIYHLERVGRYLVPSKKLPASIPLPGRDPGMGLRPDELLAAARIARSIRADLEKIHAAMIDERARLGAAANLEPFRTRRRETIQAGTTQLKTSLPAESWDRLRSWLRYKFLR